MQGGGFLKTQASQSLAPQTRETYLCKEFTLGGASQCDERGDWELSISSLCLLIVCTSVCHLISCIYESYLK